MKNVDNVASATKELMIRGLMLNKYGAVANISEIEAVLYDLIEWSEMRDDGDLDKTIQVPVRTLSRMYDSSLLLKLYVLESEIERDAVNE
jgi:hypothetical protein